MRTLLLVLVLAPALAVAGPSKHVGQELTKGVKQELTKDKGAEETAREVGRGIVKGIAPNGGEKGARRLTREALNGAGDELLDFFGCEQKGRIDCLAGRIRQLTYAAALGTAEGASEKTSPWPMVGAFAAGVASALVAVALVALLLGQRRGRRQMAELAPHAR